MLELENFLDKDAKRKFEFLRLLEEATDLTELNSVIQERLQLSTFLFNKTIDELTQDFSEQGLSTFFALKSGPVQTTLLEAGQATSDLLLELYLKESLSFNILLALFKEDFQSTHTFALDNFTSYSSVYGRLQQIKKMLQPLEITINKKSQLTGDEANVRYLLTRVLTFVLAADDNLYPPQVHQKAQAIVNELTAAGLLLPGNVQSKLLHFLSVSLMRQAQGHDLSENANKRKVLARLKEIFAYEFGLLEKFALEPLLAEEILSFLYSHGVLPKEKAHDQELGKRITRLNNRFANRFFTQFKIEEKTLTRNLRTELSRLHFELAYFPLNAFYSFQRFDVSFFEESYIEYFLFCREYLMDEKFIKDENFLAYRPYVFYKYLMILVANVNLDQVMPSLHVCIDFSFGQEYNEFIKRNMSFFVNLNLEIQFVYSATTDIVITNLNSEYEALPVEKVIWLDPPRPTDWANLGNRILEIRAQKHRDLLHK